MINTFCAGINIRGTLELIRHKSRVNLRNYFIKYQSVSYELLVTLFFGRKHQCALSFILDDRWRCILGSNKVTIYLGTLVRN